jgi:hypothetical protein
MLVSLRVDCLWFFSIALISTWLSEPPAAADLKKATVFKFSSPAGWPCLFLDERPADVRAAEAAARAALGLDDVVRFLLPS